MIDLAQRKKALIARLRELDTRLHNIEDELDSHQAKDWEDLAAALIPTCRADSTGGFQLPASLFKNGGNLPGYVEGWTPIPDDPDCDST